VSTGSQEEQLSSPPDGALVLVIGNLTIDDVVLPTGVTRMGMLGGNSVHAATAVVTAGATAALAARRGEDFPPGALAALAAEGIDMTGLVDIPGPTVRNWVIYEADGRRSWLYRTPPERSAEVAPEPADLDSALLRRAAVVHVAAMPLGNAERIVAHVRRHAPGAVITVDTHESWDGDLAGRVLALASAASLFVPSQEELAGLVAADGPADGLRALAAAGLTRAVVKAAGAGAYVLDYGRIVRVPAAETTAADSTGAGDTFCGGLAAGLARGLSLVESAALGAAVAAVAITGSGSLRLLRPGTDRAGIAATARRLAATAAEVSPRPGGLPAGGMGAAALVKKAGAVAGGGELRSAVTGGEPRADAGGGEQRSGAAGGEPPPGAAGGGPGSAAGEGEPGADQRYDIDVMRREIAMIPDVISDVLDDAGGHVTALAKRLVTRGVQHLWLTGCGDSAFAGLAAELAFQKHSGLTAHPVHALDLARYRARALPPGSAVIALSFSGKVGRTIEAAVQARRSGHHVVALTNAADGPLAQASDEVLPLDVRTLGFSPGTSTYVAMLGTLLRLAAALAGLRGDTGELTAQLARLPEQAEATLAAAGEPAIEAAGTLLPAGWVAFLGAGPNEATARFAAAKLFEGPQQLGVATNLEEWAHEEYFVTSAGDPVVLINPAGAGHDRGAEILSELRFMRTRPVVISDLPPPAGAVPGELLLPLAAGVAEEISPVTACLPPALVGFHLARLGGKQSYNFPGEAARLEHYETIHRATTGEPA
jgi:fructoselysine-6-P-deglycase FrlB-like protein/sugar/nucleoside kinase (ribokinase family)